MRIARIFVLGFVMIAATAGSAAAGKDQVRFVGIHPIPKAQGGGLCHLETLHVHVYLPTDIKASYRVQGGAYYFIGDPQPYGWEGETVEYKGHHPIHVAHTVEVEPVEPVYCYLDGVHVHGYAPDPVVVTDFDVRAGAYVFIGVVPPAPVVVVKPTVIRPRPARGVVIEVIVDDHHHHRHHKWKHKHKRHHHDDWDDD